MSLHTSCMHVHCGSASSTIVVPLEQRDFQFDLKSSNQSTDTPNLAGTHHLLARQGISECPNCSLIARNGSHEQKARVSNHPERHEGHSKLSKLFAAASISENLESKFGDPTSTSNKSYNEDDFEPPNTPTSASIQVLTEPDTGASLLILVEPSLVESEHEDSYYGRVGEFDPEFTPMPLGWGNRETEIDRLGDQGIRVELNYTPDHSVATARSSIATLTENSEGSESPWHRQQALSETSQGSIHPVDLVASLEYAVGWETVLPDVHAPLASLAYLGAQFAVEAFTMHFD